ncbi:holo-ACP synthase [Bacillus sp. Marseille-P3661]|uniref:holo-ACP synthase n=1 Tax=Bacillus sp. Marseille-P3661 TaxID=1936234 RepID=UPI000C861B68|nr:holo-ACP synthase [Bacillus sp. Marseille-P3661]
MIKGIGIDIVELNRMKKIIERQPKFPERILTNKELEIYGKLSVSRQVEFLAGRFAVKEAFAKAKGTGIGKNLSFQDIEVLPDEFGKPVTQSNLSEEKIHLSITHSKEYALGQVIIELL